MRILVLTWRDVRHPEAGGAETYLHELSRRWSAEGHEVVAVTSRARGTARDEVIDGVRYRRAGGRLTVYFHGLIYAVVHRRSTHAVLDVINGIPFGTPLVRRLGVVALVHHVHRAQWRIIYPGVKGRLGWWLESRLATWLYRGRPYVTVSESSRADLVAIGVQASDIHLVPNGLEPRPYVGGPVSAREPRIAVLARLVPHKQVEHVLEATARLLPSTPGLQVDLIGDGWWRNRLEADVRDLGLSDVVHFHGYVNDDERDRLLARARVMVLPSAKEGWGLAVSEAAAQGTPSVGYGSSGGLSESIVDGVTGRVVQDLDGLVEATRDLLADGPAGEVMSAAARVRVGQLDWGRSAANLLRILQHEVSGARGPQRSP